MMKKRIAVDLGGTKTEIMLTENDPLAVIERKRVPTKQEEGYQFIINQIADLISDYRRQCEEPPCIGIGIPGSINPKTGLVRNANTVCLIGHSLQKDLERLIKQPIIVENDANCFALSEAVLGAGKGYSVVMGLIIGTGMGGGIVISGKIHTGLQGIGGEFGHMSINFNGPECWCGERGCLESYLSGSALEKNYQKTTGRKKSLQEIHQDFKEKGDPAAKQIIDDLLFYFGLGVANLITAFDPDMVVVGGGVSNIPALYTKGVKQIRHHIFNDQMDTPILKNQLGDSSGIFGAAILAGF